MGRPQLCVKKPDIISAKDWRMANEFESCAPPNKLEQELFYKTDILIVNVQCTAVDIVLPL